VAYGWWNEASPSARNHVIGCVVPCLCSSFSFCACSSDSILWLLFSFLFVFFVVFLSYRIPLRDGQFLSSLTWRCVLPTERQPQVLLCAGSSSHPRQFRFSARWVTLHAAAQASLAAGRCEAWAWVCVSLCCVRLRGSRGCVMLVCLGRSLTPRRRNSAASIPPALQYD
jgi:hypothetical protein